MNLYLQPGPHYKSQALILQHFSGFLICGALREVCKLLRWPAISEYTQYSVFITDAQHRGRGGRVSQILAHLSKASRIPGIK